MITKIININENSTAFSKLLAEQLIEQALSSTLNESPKIIINEVSIEENSDSKNFYIHLNAEAIISAPGLVKLLSREKSIC